MSEEAYEDKIRRLHGYQTAQYWDARAQETARNLGVDPALPAKDRCMAIMQATGMVRVAQTLVAQARKQVERVPGEDDE